MGGGLLETNNQLERFTKNKKSKKLTYSILGILLLIGSMTLFKTFAFFEEKREFNVIKGRVPSHWYDINLISVKVEGKEVESIPERGLYKTNVNCTNGLGEWDYNSWSLKLTNLKENTQCNIEFTNNLTPEEYKTYIEAGKALRRNTYRGKDITEYYNNGSLYEMISNGTFDDVYVGDFFNANGVTWLIADLDNYLYSGDQELAKHHAKIIPAKPLMETSMNATNTTEGAYIGSQMASETLPSLVSADGLIGKTFGSHIIEYRNLLSNSINSEASNLTGKWSGASDEWGWYTRKIDLMSEVNVYGTTVMSSSGYDTGIDNRQYALFQLKPEFINSDGKVRFRYWLKSISDASDFNKVDTSAASGSWYASEKRGVRPRFLIG